MSKVEKENDLQVLDECSKSAGEASHSMEAELPKDARKNARASLSCSTGLAKVAVGAAPAKPVELLCPAGSAVALHAAVRGGADAVYLGGSEFNARRGAGNFSEEELRAAVRYAHLRGVKVYLTFNIAVFENEVARALKAAKAAARAGIDAFIVQDVGMCNLLATEVLPEFPQVRLHISTQMNIHSEDGLRFAARLGAERVTLAREMSLGEIAQLCKLGRELGIEIEVFGHGALCICYSGQCLMSSMIGGRSANRGRCAQPCRLEYELCRHNSKNNQQEKTNMRSVATTKTITAANTNQNLGACRKNGNQRNLNASRQTSGFFVAEKNTNNQAKYLLSPKDLCSLDVLEQLAEAGVASLKIEGRMKSPEYVYSVARVYRATIDNLYKNNDFPANLKESGTSKKEETISEKESVQESAGEGNFTELNNQHCAIGGDTSAAKHKSAQSISLDLKTAEQHPSQANNHDLIEAKHQLAQVFSRGFSTAYLTGTRDNTMMGYSRPNNRGVKVGRVAGVSHGQLRIDATEQIAIGDVIEIWTSKGRAALRVDKNFDCGGGAATARSASAAGGGGGSATAFRGGGSAKASSDITHHIQAKLDMSVGELRGVRKGDRVFRVRRAEDEFVDTEFEPRVPVEGMAHLQIGAPLTLKLWAKSHPELAVEVQGEAVENARTRAVTNAEVEEHICRTGQTPFEITNLKVELDENVGIGFSALHHLRAEALDKLERKLLDNWKFA